MIPNSLCSWVSAMGQGVMSARCCCMRAQDALSKEKKAHASVEKELSALRSAHESLQAEKDRARADNKERHSKASPGVGQWACTHFVVEADRAHWGEDGAHLCPMSAPILAPLLVTLAQLEQKNKALQGAGHSDSVHAIHACAFWGFCMHALAKRPPDACLRSWSRRTRRCRPRWRACARRWMQLPRTRLRSARLWQLVSETW